MHDTILKFYITMKNLIEREDGQDLVEYALVVALLALGATAGMGTLATGLNTAFTTINTNLGNALA